MPKKIVPKNIVKASTGKRIAAYFIDFVIIVLFGVLVYFVFGEPVIMRNNGYYDLRNEATSYIEAPGLVLKAENGTSFSFYDYPAYDEKTQTYGYTKYEDLVWNYFTSFLPNHENYMLMPSGWTSKRDKTALTTITEADKSNPSTVGRWVYENFFQGNYYEPVKDEAGENDYTKKPVVKAAILADVDDMGLLRQRVNLREFFINPSNGSGSYSDAVDNLDYQDHLNLIDRVANFKWYAGFVPSVALAPLIFHFLIPLFVPNGRTIGKLLVGTSVIGSDGYKAKKSAIALHYGILTLMWELLLVPYLVVMILIYFLLVILDYMMVVLSKTSQGYHELASRTIVIDTHRSIWFTSESEQDLYVKEHPGSLVAHAVSDEEKPSYSRPTTKEDYGIFDSSMIGEARRKAERITSFDDFEKESELRAAHEEEAKQEEEEFYSNPDELRDAAALEGIEVEEVEKLQDEESDDFTDK